MATRSPDPDKLSEAKRELEHRAPELVEQLEDFRRRFREYRDQRPPRPDRLTRYYLFGGQYLKR